MTKKKKKKKKEKEKEKEKKRRRAFHCWFVYKKIGECQSLIILEE